MQGIEMDRTLIRIGITGAVHPNMPGDDAGLYRSVITALRERQEIDGFQLSVVAEVLHSEEDARIARDFLLEEDVDLILFFNASLPYGRCILPFADVKRPLVIWSVPEPRNDGILQLNSFCGMNLIGSILRNYFDGDDIRYKWFFGMPDSEMFQERFSVTLAALRAVKTLNNSRIGQIGELADGFENLHVDERVLKRRFGTVLQTEHTVKELVIRAESYTPSDIAPYLEAIYGAGEQTSSVGKRAMEKFARLNRAFKDFAGMYDYNALAISCWSRFQELYDVAVCAAMSRLNDSGMVAPCEADVASAVTMLMLNALNGGRSSLNDMVAVDESDGSLNLWHCGVAPGCWADKCGVKWDAHFNIGDQENTEWHGHGVVAQMQFEPGPVTIAAIDNRFEKVFVMTGNVLENKPGYAGSSGWVGNLKINGEPVNIPDLINTIMVGGVNHHYSTARGHLSAEINEFAFWTGLEVLDKVPYQTHMQKFI